MIPDDLKEEFGEHWTKVLRPLLLAIGFVAVLFSLVLAWRTVGFKDVYEVLDVWWFPVLASFAVGVGLAITIRRATANSRARHISAAAIAICVGAISAYAYFWQVPLTSMEIHIYPIPPIAESDYDVETLRTIVHEAKGRVQPRPIEVTVHAVAKEVPADIRKWIQERPTRSESGGRTANVALITTELQGKTYRVLHSTLDPGWSVVSSHLWKQHDLGSQGIDIYQYFAHQAVRTGTVAALNSEEFHLGREDSHDPNCLFDDLGRDLTAKPEIVSAPHICPMHEKKLHGTIGRPATEALKAIFVRIGQGQYSDE